MALTNSSQSYSFLGKLTVEPRIGTALQTLFTATVEGCEDDDDVQYQFGIRPASESFTFSQQTENFKSTHLAPGKIVMLVKCIDSNGAYIVVESDPVTVL